MVTLRARHVFPIKSPPVENGAVHIANGTVQAVEPASRATDFLDLGDVALLPALINAHTHLEFSNLKKPLGTSGNAFPDWIRRVVAWRRSQGDAAPEPDQPPAIQEGLAESLCHGVTMCGDIVSPVFEGNHLRSAEISGVAFFELLGLADTEISRLHDSATAFLDAFPAGTWSPGISPHAPYTISLACLEKLVELSARRRVPVAMHLAESQQERQLLETGRGSLVDLLGELDAWHPAAVPVGTRPADYLRRLSLAHRALVIHGNYLDAHEIRVLAANKERMSVVYCPRTHAYFGHDPYPLRAILDAGVNLAIGTDSRASNPDLNMFEELAHVLRAHTDVSPEEALALATSNGARALGQDRRYGSIAKGKAADLVAVEMVHVSKDPYEALLAEPPRVVAVYRAGREVFRGR
jgi:cytosine/adenosine deaminase-related metal-dependent hydrolase